MRWVVLLALAVCWCGCMIEESPENQTGSVEVHLFDLTGAEISDAGIYIDDVETGWRTPAVVSGVAVGSRRLWIWKSGYLPVDSVVEIFQWDTVQVALVAEPAEMGAVELVGAPDGVTLLLNGEPSGQTPPAIFSEIGVGDYRLSAYLPGHTTELPALWRVQVVGADTVRIPVQFTPGNCGNDVDDLPYPFSLATDWNRDLAIQDWRGHVVLINFWFVDCQACVLEFPYLQQVYEESSGDGGFQILAVNPWDAMDQICEFRVGSGLTFPFLRDGDLSVSQAYDVSVYPTNLLVDKRGVIRHRLGQVTYNELRALVDPLLSE
jgi:peroxiredoxin